MLIGIMLFIFSRNKYVRGTGVVLAVGFGLGSFLEISQKKLDL